VIVSIYALAQLLTQVPAGRLADRFGRKFFMLVGFFGLAVSAALNNYAHRPVHFFIFQTLAGISAGCLWPALMALLNEGADPSVRGRLMGTFNTIFFVGLGLGPLLGGYLAATYGFMAPFNLWAATAVAAGVICAFGLQEKPKPAADGTAGRPAVLSSSGLVKPGMLPTFLAGCVVRARGGFCSSFNNSILPLYVVGLYSATPKMIGSMMFVHAVGLAFFNVPGGMVSDRFGRKSPALLGSLVATTGVFWYSFANGLGSLLGAVGLAGAGSAFATPAIGALTADISNPEKRAEAFGYFLTSFHVGVIFGAAVFGVVSDWVGLPGAVLAWGITSLILSLCSLLIREPTPAQAMVARPAIAQGAPRAG
jgi:MFS family permease